MARWIKLTTYQNRTGVSAKAIKDDIKNGRLLRGRHFLITHKNYYMVDPAAMDAYWEEHQVEHIIDRTGRSDQDE